MRPTCPFCHAPITEALALHGGPCPSCFAEIPGEDSATDPGEEVKAQQAEADRAVAQRKARLPLLIAAPVMLALAGATLWALRPASGLEELRFEDEDFGFEIELVATALADEAEEEQQPVARAAARRTGGDARAAQRGGAGVEARAARERADGGTAEAGGTRSAAELARAVSGSSEAPISFDAQRTAAVLESREDVQAAIGQMWRARSPRLRQCYERALKGNAELAGEWRLSFTIVEDGSVREPAATGVHTRDAGLEACITTEMAAWRLRGRLDAPWPVSFPIKFKGHEG